MKNQNHHCVKWLINKHQGAAVLDATLRSERLPFLEEYYYSNLLRSDGFHAVCGMLYAKVFLESRASVNYSYLTLHYNIGTLAP